jgi:hypothetical protein
MADTNMMAKVETYLAILQEIRKKTGDDKLAQMILAEIAKDRRMEEMREERELRNGEPATSKQLEYLKKLGVQTTPGLTKKQASTLIDNALEKEEE